jgi:UrcA family protein
MLRTLPLMLAGLMVSSAALAETPREPTEVRVSIQNVNFANPIEVAGLYQRLLVAAKTACNSEINTPSARAEDRACAAEALDGAVKSLHQPSLLAIRSGTTELKVASNGF